MASTLSKPYGILLPIQRGDAGYFNQSYDVLEQMKSDFVMLMNTRPGERRMNPRFGTSLYSVLFEYNNEELAPIVSNIIQRDTATWLPMLSILSIKVDTSTQQRNIYTVSINVIFTIKGTIDSGNQEVNLSFSQPIA